MSGISEELLSALEQKTAEDENVQVLSAAAAKTELKELAYVPVNASKLNGDFEIEVKTRGITAQQKSGRCWMFAALNMLREGVAERLDLKEFEFSQNYLTFYDKLEKADNFLEMVIRHSSEPLDGQMMQYILRGIDDGGYWSMAKDLIRKYGVVPKSAFPETYQSDHTASFLKLINEVLRKDAMELRTMLASGKDVSKRKEEMLAEIYKAECIAFGTPVKKFDFEYRDAKGDYHSHKDLTPKQFYEIYVGKDLEDYVAIINEPVSNRQMETPVVFHSLGNMADSDLTALNLPMDQLERLCIDSLKGGDAMWFACDAGAYGARKEGIWDPDSFTYGKLLGGIDASMPKKERLEYRNSAATHAMLLTGVNFDEAGKPNRWKIENSWGKENGRNGYYVASESYFRDYVYEAVIAKKYLSEAQKAMLEKKPVVIQPWEEE